MTGTSHLQLTDALLEKMLVERAGPGAPGDLIPFVAAAIESTGQRAPGLFARWFGRNRGIRLLAAAALLLVGGAIAAGSGVLRLPSVVTPEPAPTIPVAVANPTLLPTTAPTTTTPTPTPTGTLGHPAGPGAWTATSSMTTPREGHTATLLPNGKVLVAGGRNVNDFRSSAELYDPVTGSWSKTGSMRTPRAGATATQLPNGNVLVAGGFNGDDRGWTSLDSAELYDPGTGTWVVTGRLGTSRMRHSATLLPNGKVLVAGGQTSGPGLASAELYDPATGIWTATGSMSVARFGHSATLLPDGTVLVAGDVPLDFDSHSAVAELYDPRTGTWIATGSMTTPRQGSTAALLPDGTVLVAGGAASAELYDPGTRTWTATGSMLDDAPYGSVATLLPNGTVLVVGASNSNSTPGYDAELYGPATGSWTPAGPMIRSLEDFTATFLPGGTVLIAGGRQPLTLLGSTPSYDFADLFNPGAGR